LAAGKGIPDVLQNIYDLAKNNLTGDEIKNNLFLATNNEGTTALHSAALRSNQNVLQKIGDFAKKSNSRGDKNKLFLATDIYGNTAWYLAARRGNQDILQKVCNLAKDYLTTEEIKSKRL